RESFEAPPLSETEEQEHEGRVLVFLRERYEATLNRALENRWAVVLVMILTLVVSLVFYHFLGSEFLPEFDESAFVLDYLAPAGASLQETDRMLQHVEKLIRETPDIESYSRRTGLELGLFITEPNKGDFAVKLKPRHQPTEDVISDLRKEIEKTEPALEIEFLGILPDMIGELTSSPEPIEIKLFSEDANALHQKAEEVEAAILKLKYVVDTKSGVIVSGPAVTFKIDPRK